MDGRLEQQRGHEDGQDEIGADIDLNRRVGRQESQTQADDDESDGVRKTNPADHHSDGSGDSQ